MTVKIHLLQLNALPTTLSTANNEHMTNGIIYNLKTFSILFWTFLEILIDFFEKTLYINMIDSHLLVGYLLTFIFNNQSVGLASCLS